MIQLKNTHKISLLVFLLIFTKFTFAHCHHYDDNGKEYPWGTQEWECASYQETCEPIETTICTFEVECKKNNGDTKRQVYFYKDFTRCNYITNINGQLKCKFS